MNQNENELSEEVKNIIKQMAFPDMKNRVKALRVASKMITHSALTHNEMIAITKGIYYALWQQDKLLKQEDVVEIIVNVITTVKDSDSFLSYVNAMFETLSREWDNLDKYRQDKFMLLFREFFKKAWKHSLTLKSLDGFAAAVFNHVLNDDLSTALEFKWFSITVIKEEFTNGNAGSKTVSTFLLGCINRLLTLVKGVSYVSDLTTLIHTLMSMIPGTKISALKLLSVSEQILVMSCDFPQHQRACRSIAQSLVRIAQNKRDNENKKFKKKSRSKKKKALKNKGKVEETENADKNNAEESSMMEIEVPDTKRVSFGKIYRKKFSVRKSVTFPDTVMKKNPSKSILRKNGRS